MSTVDDLLDKLQTCLHPKPGKDYSYNVEPARTHLLKWARKERADSVREAFSEWENYLASGVGIPRKKWAARYADALERGDA